MSLARRRCSSSVYLARSISACAWAVATSARCFATASASARSASEPAISALAVFSPETANASC